MRGRPGLGKNGMSQREAVLRAIEDVGTITSIAYLTERATWYYGKPVHHTLASTVRSEHRRKLKLKEDCRTYESQPRRNMLDDSQLSLAQVKRVLVFVKKVKDFKILTDLIGSGTEKFHSIDQLTAAWNTLQAMQMTAKAA